MQQLQQNLGRIKAFDGLRGIASILIVFYHKEIITIGWIGVPIFFVFSGYLITDILLHNIDSKNYFKTFYFRRALRIFPIYYISFIACILYGLIIGENVRQWDWFWYLMYFQNYFWGQLNFAWFFNHTWSLAIEEQFYLVWPLLIFVFYKKNITNHIVFVCLVISFLAKVFFISKGAFMVNYTNTLTNFDIILFGSLISINKSKILTILNRSNIHILWLGFILFALIIFNEKQILSVFSLTNTFTKGNVEGEIVTYLTILMTAIFILITLHKNYNKTYHFLRWLLLENPMWVYLGKISYGIYLYHYIIFAITANKMLQLSNLVFHKENELITVYFTILVSILVAILSWEFFEKPLLKFKDKIRY